MERMNARRRCQGQFSSSRDIQRKRDSEGRQARIHFVILEEKKYYVVVVVVVVVAL